MLLDDGVNHRRIELTCMYIQSTKILSGVFDYFDSFPIYIYNVTKKRYTGRY